MPVNLMVKSISTCNMVSQRRGNEDLVDLWAWGINYYESFHGWTQLPIECVFCIGLTIGTLYSANNV